MSNSKMARRGGWQARARLSDIDRISQITPQSGQTRARVGRCCCKHACIHTLTRILHSISPNMRLPRAPHPHVLVNIYCTDLQTRVQLGEAWVGEILDAYSLSRPNLAALLIFGIVCRATGYNRDAAATAHTSLFAVRPLWYAFIYWCRLYTNPLSIHARYKEPSLLDGWLTAAVQNLPYMTKTKTRYCTNSTAINMGSGCGI